MCVRRKGNVKSIKGTFAPQAQNSAEIVATPAQRLSRLAAAVNVLPQSLSNEGKDAKEKAVKVEPRAIVPIALGSTEFIRKRRDDDTLREVGNVMPEYDCDKDDPPQNLLEKTQDSVDK